MIGNKNPYRIVGLIKLVLDDFMFEFFKWFWKLVKNDVNVVMQFQENNVIAKWCNPYFIALTKKFHDL